MIRGTMLFTMVLLSGCASERMTRKIYAMGTSLEIETVARNRDDALRATEIAAHEVAATENRLSTWIAESEMSRLNRAPPRELFSITEELYEDLTAAFRCAELTDYAFHPGLGSLVELWGSRRTKLSSMPPKKHEIQAAVRASDRSHFQLFPTRFVRRDPSFKIEEGGIGKGLALDRAARSAIEGGARNLVMNFGGQILMAGDSNSLRIFEVAHPRRRKELIAEWPIRSGSLATSGLSERGNHIIDPKSGQLVRTSGSVTVWANTATEADCLSTAFLVMGRKAAFDWLEKNSSPVQAVFAEATQPGTFVQIYASCGLRNKLLPSVPSSVLNFACKPM